MEEEMNTLLSFADISGLAFLVGSSFLPVISTRGIQKKRNYIGASTLCNSYWNHVLKLCFDFDSLRYERSINALGTSYQLFPCRTIWSCHIRHATEASRQKGLLGFGGHRTSIHIGLNNPLRTRILFLYL